MRTILKSELSSLDMNGLFNWIKKEAEESSISIEVQSDKIILLKGVTVEGVKRRMRTIIRAERRDEQKIKARAFMEYLEKVVSAESGIEDIFKKSRKTEFVNARSIYYFLVRDKYGESISYRELGRGVDHATVYHGILKIDDQLDIENKGGYGDKDIMELFKNIEAKIENYEY